MYWSDSSSRKDAAGQPLQEEYYYMPENDEDRERTTLVSNIKGHGGLRSQKTHKQYYWKTSTNQEVNKTFL